MKKTLSLLTFAALLSGCSTAQNVTPGTHISSVKMTRACFFPQGGNSVDMDERVQKGLERHGVAVLTPPMCDKNSTNVDMTVVYTDQWRWDLTMYMKAVDVRFYTVPGADLIAAGHWNNSLLHRFPDTDAVVANLIDDMFAEAAGATARTGAVSK